jgi:hypothetical protein
LVISFVGLVLPNPRRQFLSSSFPLESNGWGIAPTLLSEIVSKPMPNPCRSVWRGEHDAWKIGRLAFAQEPKASNRGMGADVEIRAMAVLQRDGDIPKKKSAQRQIPPHRARAAGETRRRTVSPIRQKSKIFALDSK